MSETELIDVIGALMNLFTRRGLPAFVRMRNVIELSEQAVGKWIAPIGAKSTPWIRTAEATAYWERLMLSRL